MTDARRRYVRVYYPELEADYPEIWFDPTCLSTWLRLLTLCDVAWPNPGKLPRSVRRADLAKLQAAGLVTLLDHDRFTMKGWVKERTERADKARESYAHRKDRPTPQPTTVPTVVPSNEGSAHAGGSPSPSISISASKEGVAGEPPDTFDAYWSLTTRYPKAGGATWLDRLTTTYGSEAVIRTLVAKWTERADNSTLLSRTEDALLHEARQLDRKEQEAEKARLREKRAIPKVMPAWEQEFRAALEQKYGGAA